MVEISRSYLMLRSDSRLHLATVFLNERNPAQNPPLYTPHPQESRGSVNRRSRKPKHRINIPPFLNILRMMLHNPLIYTNNDEQNTNGDLHNNCTD